MKTSTLILVVFTGLLVLFAGASMKIYSHFVAVEREVGDSVQKVDLVIGDGVALAQVLKDIKFDVVQVQQWLTDISATRAMDGLNDGKDKAAEFAEMFHQDVAKAKKIATRLGLKDVVTSLDEMQQNFAPYYKVGQRMADAYVQFGPEGGNKIMGDFDQVAEKMAESLDGLTTVIDRHTTSYKSALVEDLTNTKAETKATIDMLVVVLSVVFFAILGIGAYVFTLLKRRAKQTGMLISQFEHSVHQISSQLSAQAESLLGRANDMNRSMKELSEKSEATSADSVEMSGSVQFIASAIEELSISVSEIRSQVVHSNEVVAESSQIMNQAEEVSVALKDAVVNITEVLKLIDGLAGQISMLALNATIESARAGEAGKGFAVVAGEVKTLAVETTNATSKIAEKISEVTACSDSVLSVVHALKDSMRSVGEYSTSISGAVDQQGAATQEISRRMDGVADHTQGVDDSLRFVSSVSNENYHAAMEVLDSAKMLNEQSEKLSHDVDAFLQYIRKLA